MATFIRTDDGRKFDFLTFLTVEGGFLLDEPAAVEEELTTPGVDGMRWRIESYQHRRAVIQTVAALVDFPSAIHQGREYLKAVGRLATVSPGITGLSFSNVHVVDVRPTPRPGPPVGGGASSDSTAHILALWTLQLTGFSPSPNE